MTAAGAAGCRAAASGGFDVAEVPVGPVAHAVDRLPRGRARLGEGGR